MNLSTFLITAVIALIVVFDIRYLMKNGTCNGNCGSCGTGNGSSCKWTKDIEKAKKGILKSRK